MGVDDTDCAGRECGAVLIASLVLLVIMTLFATSAMQGTILEERIAGNLRQHNVALQAAEAALQAALGYVDAQAAPPVADARGSEQVWEACTLAAADAATDACNRLDEVIENWLGDPERIDAGSRYELFSPAPLTGVARQPRVFIEARYVPPLDVESAAAGIGVHYFTVTALGFGGNERTRVIVQSTVAKLYGG